jgi:hypothetical protein
MLRSSVLFLFFISFFGLAKNKTQIALNAKECRNLAQAVESTCAENGNVQSVREELIRFSTQNMSKIKYIYHPKSNGSCEDISRVIEKNCRQSCGDWPCTWILKTEEEDQLVKKNEPNNNSETPPGKYEPIPGVYLLGAPKQIKKRPYTLLSPQTEVPTEENQSPPIEEQSNFFVLKRN